MTDVQNYVSDAPKSRQRNRKSEREHAFLPPDQTQRRDSIGRPQGPQWEGDGEVKYRPTHQLASHRLKSILVERALESEAINAPLVAALNIGSRPDRLTAPLVDIYDTILDYFQSTNITLSELRDTNRRSGIVSYVRGIVFEIAVRHTRHSTHSLAAKFGCDHSSVSYVRNRIRNILSYNDIEARALRADLNAITVSLAYKFDWKNGGARSRDRRVVLSQKLANHIKTINLFWSLHGRDQPLSIVGDITEACKLLMEDGAL